ncbi:MAG: kinase [Candidatus Accumulibacter sp.]|uniref:GHMP family kinase ATP-binding protein n=1 Tax=Accumulibacter sp. TaxID=2053492 RepID=UPI00287983FC|nr:kinase [Accumulibacter sp.]MDS4013433.1 kinase [Accumulibacter sp.]
MIITRTPFRISFFGGGTDYPAWYREHGGAVLATTINKYCYISCRQLPPFFEHKHRIVYSLIENVRSIADIRHPAVRAVLATMRVEDDLDGLEIHHDGDLPARAGLGSSSSFTVGLIHAIRALRGQYVSKDELAKEAIHVEQDVIRENVGSQDQVSAAFGGLNRIEFRRDDSIDVAPVIVERERLASLQDHLMLFFTGISRIASDVAKSKIDNLGNRRDELQHMRAMVDEAIGILQRPATPIEDFGRLLDEGWRYKRSLSDQVSTPHLDALYDAARSAGALGGKLLGAGGGGFFLLFAPPAAQANIRERLGDLVHVPFRFENSGSRVMLYQPNGL